MPRGVYQSSKRGLASANSKTRKKVAQLGGLVCALKLGEIYCEDRGQRGGLAFLEKYGKEGMKQVRQGLTIRK